MIVSIRHGTTRMQPDLHRSCCFQGPPCLAQFLSCPGVRAATAASHSIDVPKLSCLLRSNDNNVPSTLDHIK